YEFETDFVAKHVMDGAVYSQQLADSSGDEPEYTDIKRIGVSSDAPITINNSTKVISPDITTENGVIHVIDRALSDKINITDKSQKLSNEESDRNAKQSSISRSAQSLGIRRFTNWLNKSGLLDELTRDGRDYTVIVPTDRAVGKLPLKIQSILNSEPSRLTNLLEYHIIPGFVDTKGLKDNEMLTTINSKQIRFNRLDNGRVETLSGAPINRQSTNKNLLIIAVDSVLYPPQGTVGDLIKKSPFLKTLNEIIKNAQMEDELRNSSDITLFAPKDEALKQLSPEILERLKTDQNYSREVEQKPYSPTSWTHQQNISHTPAQTYPRQPARQQLNWWDSRYEPEVYSMAGYAPPSPQQQPSPQTRDQDPRSPFQSAQTRADRQRNYRPGVVYVDQSVPQFYRPPVKDGSGRPYYRPPNDTKSGSYPQSSRAGAPRAQRPSSDVYSRPEYIDRSYVPSYDPYGRPTMVVGEYPYTHMDQPYSPMDQFRPRDPYQRPQRFDPFDRRRPGSDTKTSSSTYDSIRRRGDQRSGRPDEEKPQSKPDLKTISEIIESPDLMVGGKFKTFNTLKELITDSGLWEALNRPTTFITIFMPTDDAFAAITDGSVEEMKRNPKLVRDFLTQHILGYSLPPQNLKNNMKVKSLNGEMHMINVIDGGKILVDGNEVIAATAAKNGNVYVMDKMLDRSGRRSRSIADELRKRSDLSTFSSLMQRSDLNSKLSRESGPFTVLVPNNEALNKMNLRELIRSQKDLNDFVAKHVMDGAVYSQQLADSSGNEPEYTDIKRIGVSSGKQQDNIVYLTIM
ncbi:unnamed protein product, partial [Oppiella nova]